jgi:hypothetical protein
VAQAVASSVFAYAGGERAFRALAAARRRRCLLDPVLKHPFSRGTRADHVERLAGLRAYMEWAVQEVLSCSPPGARVPSGLPVPRWSWDGPAGLAG